MSTHDGHRTRPAGGAGRPPDRAALEARAVGAMRTWELEPDGPARWGGATFALPVLRAGRPAVLTVRADSPETRHAHLALRSWAGRGAPRLLAADPGAGALLLERLDHTRTLADEPVEAACVVIGGLLAALRRPPLPQVVPATSPAREIAGTNPAAVPALPRRFVEQARAAARDLLRDPQADAALAHGDVTYRRVLAGGPERPGAWAATGPRPVNAEPAYAVWPALRDRHADTGGDLRREVQQRLGLVCEAAGIDEDRARAWSIVRAVREAQAATSTAPATDVTGWVVLLKALQPGW